MILDPPTAVYIHVPFCRRRCTYCDFYSGIGCADDFSLWHAGIGQEIAMLTHYPEKKALTSVYFGGGTPSVPDASMPATQLTVLRRLFGISPDAEVTLEANPESVTAEKAGIWLDAGINRISLGLQSADPAVLRTLGRPHTAEDFVQAVDVLRQAGFTNISADLMLGIPGQSLTSLEQSLALVTSLPLQHVSFYALSLEPGTAMHDRFAGRFPSEAEEDLERCMYWRTRDLLSKAGYRVYEISNAAKPGFEAKHNLVYWRAEPYFGLGPSAASYVDGIRRQHPASLAAWREQLNKSDTNLSRQATCAYTTAPPVEVIDAEEARREYMLLGLRLTDGVDLAAYQKRFGDDPKVTFAAAFAELQTAGLIEKMEKTLTLTKHGVDMANQAFAAFL